MEIELLHLKRTHLSSNSQKLKQTWRNYKITNFSSVNRIYDPLNTHSHSISKNQKDKRPWDLLSRLNNHRQWTSIYVT